MYIYMYMYLHTYTYTHIYAYMYMSLIYAYVCICVRQHMGWLRLVGSIKLWVSFAEYHLFYRAFLQKRPIILRSLLVEATPYDII